MRSALLRITSSRRRRSQRGFTLIELMVSLVLFSFAIAGVLAVAVAMANGFREQRATIGTEGASRAAMEFLAEAVRGASPGVPTGNIQIADAGCPAPATPITVVNNSAGVTSLAGTDELFITFAYGSFVTSARTAYAPGNTTLDVEDYSQLADGDTLIITDTLASGTLLKIAGPVASNTLTIAAQGCVGDYVPGALVIRGLRARFFVENLDGIPTLWMDPDAEGAAAAEPLAEGIEDMQIAIAIDSNADGLIGPENATGGDLDEWVYNNAADTLLPGAIRAVRITLVARAANQATGIGRFYPVPAEDHSPALVADKYRRRSLRSIIEVRNLAGSP